MDVREHWRTEHLQAAAYDFAVQHKPLARLGARLLWSYDVRHLWRSIESLPRTLTLDVPCGGGLAIRDNPHHVAADLSPIMLARARRKNPTALLQADITNLPFASSTFETCVTYNGLHCVEDPANAVAELARVLRPGGTLHGTTVVRGTTRRHETLIALMRHLNLFGPSGTTSDLRGWLVSAGLTDIALTPSGAVTGFTARKPPDIEDAAPSSIR
ncbi:class I SAM-dependent methyltransferase [Actinomadura fibrosa]|uniref:Class I SAM-dependent methyltransferase n=1 Tax=Actinomadura fibrosa TaxID=111802 RepID=A0ABW2XFN0_9ACTN|nr:class I SAM-dependent methyltransferase [Actinomadura fibrosa]